MFACRPLIKARSDEHVFDFLPVVQGDIKQDSQSLMSQDLELTQRKGVKLNQIYSRHITYYIGITNKSACTNKYAKVEFQPLRQADDSAGISTGHNHYQCSQYSLFFYIKQSPNTISLDLFICKMCFAKFGIVFVLLRASR